MTLIIEIKPGVQQALHRQASVHGVDLAEYADSLFEEAAHLPTSAKHLTLGDVENTLRDLAQFSHKIPSLPDEAFSRESLYPDYN